MSRNVHVHRDGNNKVDAIYARPQDPGVADEKLDEGHADVQAFYNSQVEPAPNPKIATVNPAATDDSSVGYKVGCLWINTTTPSWWGCSDDTTGAAVWTQLG